MAMKLIFLGLGKMGYRMAEKLARDEHELIVWNRTQEVTEGFKSENGNVEIASSVEEAIGKGDVQKIVWLMLPAGAPTDEILTEVKGLVGKNDIMIDGGNSFYKDTQRRYEELESLGIKFLGIGVSGGIIAEKEGYPMMVGGDKSAYETIVPLLDSLAKPHGGHEYFGTGGAGHFVKMVHNGIEYGMMQAIGEGFGVLEKAPYMFDLLKIAKLWQQGTIVDSFLIDRAKDALEKDGELSDIIGEIDATGEGEWTINQAKEEGVPVENIEQSLDFRRRSKVDPNIRDSFAAKMVAALRREFGGHAVKKKE
jgi:6-phosphogluconate dehydrogenase